MKFNFPAVTFVRENTAAAQFQHVHSECHEVAFELLENRVTAADLEMMDLLHSSESYFRIRMAEMGPEYLRVLMDTVMQKNLTRGYYGECRCACMVVPGFGFVPEMGCPVHDGEE